MIFEKHRGDVVAKAVKNSNFTIKFLAEKLEISRNTVYNKFKEHDLSYDLILKIGDIIKHDFSMDFPEMKSTVGVSGRNQLSEVWLLEQKYTRLLEKYNNLLTFLMRIASDYNMPILKTELEKFLNNPSAYNSL